MPKMQKQCVKLKGQKKGKPRYGLRCEKCGNRLMMVIEEPVSRQERSNTAHHKRVIAFSAMEDSLVTSHPSLANS